MSKINKWYYINERYYPSLISEETIKCWDSKDIDRIPTDEEIDGWDNRDVETLPLIVPVYIAKDIEKEIKEKIDLYLYYVGTSKGAVEFIELDKEGKTDLDEIAGTTRVFKYCFEKFMEGGS